MSDPGQLPTIHPREKPYSAAEMWLQQAVNEWITRHPDLTSAEILLAIQRMQSGIIERLVRLERGL